MFAANTAQTFLKRNALLGTLSHQIKIGSANAYLYDLLKKIIISCHIGHLLPLLKCSVPIVELTCTALILKQTFNKRR